MKGRTSTVVDRWGRPFALTTFFEGGDRFRGGDSSPMNYWNGANDTEQLLPTGTWQQAMSAARYLLANVPMIRGALMEQCTYSFPLEPHYRGKDKEWGKVAKEWLYHWKKSADVRGKTFDCHTAARIRLLARKTDGDIGRILTFDREDNYPRLQFVRAHRIGSAQMGDGIVKRGRYAGQQILNGVILNKRGGPMAYRVLMGSGNSLSREAEFEDVPASSFLLSYNPDYSDQSRGISELMVGITSAADLKRLNEYEMRAQQIQSREALTEDNEEGEAPPGADYSQVSGTGVYTETLKDGLTRYYRSNSGSGLTLHRPDRPGPGCEGFEARIVSRAFYGIGWDPNFALMLKEPGGVWGRIILKKINWAIRWNQIIEAKDQLAEDTYGLARATKYKIIPEPKDGDIFSWEYSGPGQLSGDSGNEEAAKREKYKIGLLTGEAWAAEDGNWFEELRETKQMEVKDLLSRAKAIKDEFPELSLMDCVNLIEQRSPNPGTGVPATAPDSAAGAGNEGTPNKE